MKPELPLYEPDEDATYQLEIIAQLSGIPRQTLLHYQEVGLIHAKENPDEFDEETLHTLRRIEHLRASCEANLSGIKLILDLMEQVERLQTELRARR